MMTALRRGWWLIVLGLLFGGLAGLALSLTATPVYTSSTQLFLATTDSSSSQAVFQGGQFSQQRVSSYAQLLQGQNLASRVVDNLDLSVSPASVAGQISVDPVPDTVLLNVSVNDPDPRRAQQIAAAIGAEFPGLVADLEPTPAGGQSPIEVAVVQEPSLPTTPSSPNTQRNVALGLFCGLVVGSAAAIGRVALDRTVKEAHVAAHLADAPVLGVILHDRSLAESHTFRMADSSPAAEGYRRLRANLQFLRLDHPPKIIMISSAMPAEGKTTLAINLALALVESGSHVALVDGDLRRPRVTRYLRLVGGVGLTNVVTGTAALHDVLQQYGSEAFSVLGAGPVPPNPSQVLSSTQMATLLDDLASKNDFVIVDSPPVLPVADASSLATIVDGVVLSARYGVTRKELLRRAVTNLEQVGAVPLGIVMNLVPARADVAEGYGYRYESGSDA